MKNNWKRLLICLAIPLIVGGLATLLSGGMGDFALLNKPPLSPPRWLFPIVWTILYLLMGYASYRVLESGKPGEDVEKALAVYGIQLFLNFLWPVFFFGFRWYWGAFVILLLLLAAIVWNARAFSKLDGTAGDLLIPYILWVSFAAYLNFGVAFLN